jgi:hypothetical protein
MLTDVGAAGFPLSRREILKSKKVVEFYASSVLPKLGTRS